MLDMNDQVEARLAKLDELRKNGINPYPYSFDFTHRSGQLIAEKGTLDGATEVIRAAGRIVRFNRKGKMCFMHIKDEDGRIQIMASLDSVGEQNFELIKLLDIGDWVGAEGTMFTTKLGEYSIHASKVVMLSKAVRPLPIPKEKIENGQKIIYDEFKDMELRYRQRYIDLVLNDPVRATFVARSKIISTIRQYLLGQNFFEVETPVLQPVYGGASARPFTTHHNAQDMTLYMRISNELYLKRCIVGGLSRVFEFSRNFRNEGMDRTHNPEFTILEFYQSYADYRDMMVHFENIYSKCAIALYGSPIITYQGTQIDLSPPWRRLTMYEALEQVGNFPIRNMSDDEVKAALERFHIKLDGGYNRGRATSELFENLCEDKLIQPTIVYDHPKESTPLCKIHRTDPELVERFEPYINGWEVGNAYSELNDPILQRKLLEEQVERGRAGEDETHPLDEDFLRAMEFGMPPTGGVGIGIDRLCMLLTDQPSIRDVLLFPLMRPE